MKFRAKLVDINCIGQFLKIFTTVGKIAKLSTLRLSETQVVLTHNERAASGGTAMWCEVNQADFFDEYRIEGMCFVMCVTRYTLRFLWEIFGGVRNSSLSLRTSTCSPDRGRPCPKV